MFQIDFLEECDYIAILCNLVNKILYRLIFILLTNINIKIQ